MIIKWDKGEILYEEGCSSYDEGKVEYHWTSGSMEFDEHWFRVIRPKSEMLFRYDLIRQVNFHGKVNVEWLTHHYERLWTPKAREIYEELMARLRLLFAEGKGAGQLVGEAS